MARGCPKAQGDMWGRKRPSNTKASRTFWRSPVSSQNNGRTAVALCGRVREPVLWGGGLLHPWCTVSLPIQVVADTCVATMAISTPQCLPMLRVSEVACHAMSVGCESDVYTMMKGDLLETFETSQFGCGSLLKLSLLKAQLWSWAPPEVPFQPKFSQASLRFYLFSSKQELTENKFAIAGLLLGWEGCTEPFSLIATPKELYQKERLPPTINPLITWGFLCLLAKSQHHSNTQRAWS